MTQSNPSPNSFMQLNERIASRNRSPRGRSPSGRMCRWPCKDFLRGPCNNSFCENGTSRMLVLQDQEWLSVWGKKCSFAHRQVDEQPTKRSKKNDDKSAVAFLKKGDWQEREPVTDQCHDRSGKPGKGSDKKLGQNSSKRRSSDARQLGCVFQDMTPPKSILRKGTDRPKPIQRVKFTKATARHTKTRHQNPSFGYTCPGEPHQRSPNAPKFEDRSQEEIEWQEQGAREAAWKLAKNVLKLKEHQRATFFSSSENRCLLASTLKPEERKFVVDSCASMHMISKKDLSDAEMDTLTKSCSPTIVTTANGEAQTHEEATVCVKELDVFLTMKVLDNTPAVLSLGKLCDENEILMNGSMVKNHISLKTGLGFPATRRTSFLLWFQACQQIRLQDLIHQLQGHVQDRRVIVQHLLQARPSPPTVSEIQTREREGRTESDISPVTVSTTDDERSGRPDINQANQNRKKKQIKKGTQEATGRPVVYRLRSCKF